MLMHHSTGCKKFLRSCRFLADKNHDAEFRQQPDKLHEARRALAKFGGGHFCGSVPPWDHVPRNGQGAGVPACCINSNVARADGSSLLRLMNPDPALLPTTLFAVMGPGFSEEEQCASRNPTVERIEIGNIALTLPAQLRHVIRQRQHVRRVKHRPAPLPHIRVAH